jgi:hypothetical protein
MANTSGKEWEREFDMLCQERGLRPCKMHACSCFDFWCNGLRIQCKYVEYVHVASRNTRHIRIGKGSGCNSLNNYKANDFDLFAIKHAKKIFFVPVVEVGERNGKMKRKLDLRVLKRFENAWHIIENKKCFGGLVQQMLF